MSTINQTRFAGNIHENRRVLFILISEGGVSHRGAPPGEAPQQKEVNMSDKSEQLERAMKSFDCPKCPNRIGTVPHSTNRGTDCKLRYKQNPRTITAARNLIANGGKLCLRHPMKYV
jgi:hypothetical protein